MLLFISFQNDFSKSDLDSFRLALFARTKSRSQQDCWKDTPRRTCIKWIPKAKRKTRFLQCRMYLSFFLRSQMSFGVFPMRTWYLSIIQRVKGLTSGAVTWRFSGNGGKSLNKSMSWVGISRSTLEKMRRKEREATLDEYLVKLFFSSLIL